MASMKKCRKCKKKESPSLGPKKGMRHRSRKLKRVVRKLIKKFYRLTIENKKCTRIAAENLDRHLQVPIQRLSYSRFESQVSDVLANRKVSYSWEIMEMVDKNYERHTEVNLMFSTGPWLPADIPSSSSDTLTRPTSLPLVTSLLSKKCLDLTCRQLRVQTQLYTFTNNFQELVDSYQEYHSTLPNNFVMYREIDYPCQNYVQLSVFSAGPLLSAAVSLRLTKILKRSSLSSILRDDIPRALLNNQHLGSTYQQNHRESELYTFINLADELMNNCQNNLVTLANNIVECRENIRGENSKVLATSTNTDDDDDDDCVLVESEKIPTVDVSVTENHMCDSNTGITTSYFYPGVQKIMVEIISCNANEDVSNIKEAQTASKLTMAPCSIHRKSSNRFCRTKRPQRSWEREYPGTISREDIETKLKKINMMLRYCSNVEQRRELSHQRHECVMELDARSSQSYPKRRKNCSFRGRNSYARGRGRSNSRAHSPRNYGNKDVPMDYNNRPFTNSTNRPTSGQNQERSRRTGSSSNLFSGTPDSSGEFVFDRKPRRLQFKTKGVPVDRYNRLGECPTNSGLSLNPFPSTPSSRSRLKKKGFEKSNESLCTCPVQRVSTVEMRLKSELERLELLLEGAHDLRRRWLETKITNLKYHLALPHICDKRIPGTKCSGCENLKAGSICDSKNLSRQLDRLQLLFSIHNDKGESEKWLLAKIKETELMLGELKLCCNRAAGIIDGDTSSGRVISGIEEASKSNEALAGEREESKSVEALPTNHEINFENDMKVSSTEEILGDTPVDADTNEGRAISNEEETSKSNEKNGGEEEKSKSVEVHLTNHENFQNDDVKVSSTEEILGDIPVDGDTNEERAISNVEETSESNETHGGEEEISKPVEVHPTNHVNSKSDDVKVNSTEI